jgi:chromosome segregation ATPase
MADDLTTCSGCQDIVSLEWSHGCVGHNARAIEYLRAKATALRDRVETLERTLAGEREVIVALNRRAEAAEAEDARLTQSLVNMAARADAEASRARMAEAQRDALAEALREVLEAIPGSAHPDDLAHRLSPATMRARAALKESK